jgi:hypothetical protein
MLFPRIDFIAVCSLAGWIKTTISCWQLVVCTSRLGQSNASTCVSPATTL